MPSRRVTCLNGGDVMCVGDMRMRVTHLGVVVPMAVRPYRLGS